MLSRMNYVDSTSLWLWWCGWDNNVIVFANRFNEAHTRASTRTWFVGTPKVKVKISQRKWIVNWDANRWICKRDRHLQRQKIRKDGDRYNRHTIRILECGTGTRPTHFEFALINWFPLLTPNFKMFSNFGCQWKWNWCRFWWSWRRRRR